MKCIVLAAGYATRLYPLTENFPKPLLKVGEKTILDWLLDDIDNSGKVDGYAVVSNAKFAHHFEQWASGRSNVTVVNDGTSTNETRLGAVKDVQFAIEKLGIKDDVLVIAGDNVLDFSLRTFIDYAGEKGTSCIMRYYEADEQRLYKSGIVEVDSDDKVISMEEKPSCPKSHWCCPPFYYYTAKDTALFAEGIREGCGVDAPGSYAAWLATKTSVHAMEMPGSRYDIGSLDSYHKVCETYRGITK